MIDKLSKKAKSMLNYKKALVFIVRKKLSKKTYHGKIRSFSGYQNLFFFKAKAKEKIDLEFTVKKGYACLVLIQKDMFFIVTEESCDKKVTLPVKKGWARLRLIGDKTSVDFVIKRLVN
ncbi:MAG: hypothetical protein ACQERX_04580 [Bacillota bacterium]